MQHFYGKQITSIIENKFAIHLLDNCRLESVFSKVFQLLKCLAKIVIDDFGAGHSNFERLLSPQPDILKLHGSLIKDIHKNKYSKDIIETIKIFADKQNIRTVAEFVSCKEVYDIVIEIGIDYLQGFYLGEPNDYLAQEPLNI